MRLDVSDVRSPVFCDYDKCPHRGEEDRCYIEVFRFCKFYQTLLERKIVRGWGNVEQDSPRPNGRMRRRF